MSDFNWHVRIVLDNDQATYEHRCELTRQALRENHPTYALQELLKEFVEELIYPDVDEDDALPLMARELLGAAMSAVDWHKLAKGYVDDAESEGLMDEDDGEDD